MAENASALDRFLYHVNISNIPQQFGMFFLLSIDVANQNWQALLFTAIIILLGIYLMTRPSADVLYQRSLEGCWKELKRLIDQSNCNPILLRLAWSDAATYDKWIPVWPLCGGVNGSIVFDSELADPHNAGLSKAVAILRPVS